MGNLELSLRGSEPVALPSPARGRPSPARGRQMVRSLPVATLGFEWAGAQNPSVSFGCLELPKRPKLTDGITPVLILSSVATSDGLKLQLWRFRAYPKF